MTSEFIRKGVVLRVLILLYHLVFVSKYFVFRIWENHVEKHENQATVAS